MTDVFASWTIAVGDSMAVSIVAKATFVAAVGLLVVLAMRSARASRRSVVLAWTFAALGALPAIALVADPLTIVVRQTTMQAQPSASPDSIMATSHARGTAAAVPAGGSPAGQPMASGDRITRLAGGAWALGFVLCLVPMLRTLRRLRVQRLEATVWRTGGPATVLQHPDVPAPMTCGLLRPVILLPQDLSQWADVDIERALVHELEHVRRRDWPVHLFARFVCALYWFHPLVWQAWRQLYLEADRACDDAVVSRGDGQAFAEQLVQLAGRVSSRAPTMVPSMAGGDLSRRVLAMVNPGQARGRSGAACASAAAVTAVAVAAAIAPLKAVTATIVVPMEVDRATMSAQPSIDRRAVPALTPTPPLARAEDDSQATAPRSQPRVEPAAAAPANEPPPVYTIGISDVLSISVWPNRDLSAEVIVRPDGKITLPLINDVAVAGLTPDALRAAVEREARSFVSEPKVTVAVKEINSRRVFIAGEAVKPGEYSLLSPTTVMQLIAMAGGRTKTPGEGKVVVVRDGQRLVLDYLALARGEKLEQNILLRPGDLVILT